MTHWMPVGFMNACSVDVSLFEDGRMACACACCKVFAASYLRAVGCRIRVTELNDADNAVLGA
jgi:hypothetical protein